MSCPFCYVVIHYTSIDVCHCRLLLENLTAIRIRCSNDDKKKYYYHKESGLSDFIIGVATDNKEGFGMRLKNLASITSSHKCFYTESRSSNLIINIIKC